MKNVIIPAEISISISLTSVQLIHLYVTSGADYSFDWTEAHISCA